MKIIRISTIGCLLFSLLTLGACKKTVYNNVNQVFSATYTIKPTDWASSDGNHSFGVSLTVPEVDDVVVANGGVVTYLSLDNGASWESLPEVFGGFAYGTTHTKGFVGVDIQSAVDPSNTTIAPPTGTVLVKVVILDGQSLD